LSTGRATLSDAEAIDARGSGAGTLLWLSTCAAIILTMGMLAKEHDAGTAQWLFTKPLSRPGYGLAKWAANSLAVALATVLIPGVVSLGFMAVLYRIPGWSWMDQMLAIGIVAVHTPIMIAMTLLFGTLFRSTVPIALAALGVCFTPLFLGPLMGSGVLQVFPVAALGDLVTHAARGEEIGGSDVLPLVAGTLFMVTCLGIACRRLAQQQLQ
jgi:ABC-type transport system involved in multi-copper enzyme maturation permease subunit